MSSKVLIPITDLCLSLTTVPSREVKSTFSMTVSATRLLSRSLDLVQVPLSYSSSVSTALSSQLIRNTKHLVAVADGRPVDDLPHVFRQQSGEFVVDYCFDNTRAQTPSPW